MLYNFINWSQWPPYRVRHKLCGRSNLVLQALLLVVRSQSNTGKLYRKHSPIGVERPCMSSFFSSTRDRKELWCFLKLSLLVKKVWVHTFWRPRLSGCTEQPPFGKEIDVVICWFNHCQIIFHRLTQRENRNLNKILCNSRRGICYPEAVIFTLEKLHNSRKHRYASRV